MAKRPWLRRLALSCAALPLFAQAPIFKSETRLVEVTVVVRDRQGKASGDLTAEDFQLSDAGHRQVISSFEVAKLERHELRVTREGKPAAAVERTAVTLPDRFIAFVVDDANLVPEHFPLAAIAAIRHIQDLRPGDRAAVVSTSGRMIQPFTGDGDKLRKALSHGGSMDRRETFNVSGLNGEITCMITYLKADRIRDGDAASMQNCVARGITASAPALARPGAGGSLASTGDLRRIQLENQVRAFAESIVQAGDRDVQSYFARLAELIDTMSRMPGERSIILLSPGMYIAPRFRRLQDAIIAGAVRSRVVISGVDPRGVYIRNDPDDPSTWTDSWGLAETNERLAFMDNVTSGTGGTFIHGDNDVYGVIRRLDSVPEFVYVLGFSPSPLKLDGAYHPLKVTLQQPRGLTVEARRGYYATNAEPAAAADPIEAAFFSGQEFHEIPARLQVRSSHKAGVSVMTANSFIDLRTVQFHKEAAANRADLRMGVGLFDQDGKLVKDVWKDIDLHPSDTELELLRRAGIDVDTDFQVAPGRYLVRLLVHDRAGRAMGTRSLGITIRP